MLDSARRRGVLNTGAVKPPTNLVGRYAWTLPSQLSRAEIGFVSHARCAASAAVLSTENNALRGCNQAANPPLRAAPRARQASFFLLSRGESLRSAEMERRDPGKRHGNRRSWNDLFAFHAMDFHISRCNGEFERRPAERCSCDWLRS